MLRNHRRQNGKGNPEHPREKQIVIEGQEEEVNEAVSLLEYEGKAALKEAMEEVDMSLSEAAKASLKDIKLLEEGRCPFCGHKIEQFLFTSVCPNCGWFSFISPESGNATIHLKDGTVLECGVTFDTKGDYLLGLTHGVVRFKVAKSEVRYVEFVWTDEEIREKSRLRAQEQAGICSWCERSLSDAEGDPIVVYVAFGTCQERYIFCSEACEQSFKKQYPIRVHKNCYDRSCIDCDLCIKRYSGEDESLLERAEEI